MPFQPIVPTWLAWNNGNFTSPTALTDVRTGQPFAAGGLNLGDFFDATEQEANQGSYTTTGLLHSGRYRFVQVDSGATVANVKTGTVGYLRAGTFVQSVVITNAGTGATAGTYSIAATAGSGGGSGAVIQVVVGSTGTIIFATVLQGGYGYVSVPTFSLTITGTSGGTVAAQLNSTPNLVTSADQVAAGTAVPVRPVVFLNSITPGNYGFIQELGTATVLATSGVGTTTIAALVDATPANNGLVVTRAAAGSPIGYTIGQALDAPANSILFKIELQYVPVVQD
jgi:hypothetical protein